MDEIIRIDLPASHRYLNVLGGCISEILKRVEGPAIANETVAGIELAVHEICTNVVEHAYRNKSAERIEVEFAVLELPRSLRVTVRDTGASFDLAKVPTPDLEQVQEHGYGLFLVRELMDEVWYEPRSSGNQWHLTKFL